MRSGRALWIGMGISIAWLAAPAADAYQLSVTAGADGEGTFSAAVDSLEASHFGSVENGFYEALADAPSGALSAHVATSQLGFTVYQKRSVARIEERITFKSNPTGPVTVQIGFGFQGEATATSGVVVAMGGVGTSGYAGSCSVSWVNNTATGSQFIDNCVSSPNTSPSGTGLQVVLEPADASFNDVLDLFGQVEGLVNDNSIGNATASATLAISISGTGGETILYQLQNPDSFTVPEPGASAIGAAALASLAALRRRRG